MIVAAVQVRMGSTRLPGKALADVEGKPVLHWIIERLRAATTLDGVVVATSDSERDDPIRTLAAALDIPCFSGSEDDVVDRLHATARETNATALVRVTGDCPLVDPAVVDQVVNAYRAVGEQLDYASNVSPPTFPDGLDVEVYSRTTLERLDALTDPFWREWFAIYVSEHPAEFRAVNVQHEPDLSDLRWTLDHAEDLQFVREVYSRLADGHTVFGLEDVLALLRREPELGQINARHARNAAFIGALEERQS